MISLIRMGSLIKTLSSMFTVREQWFLLRAEMCRYLTLCLLTGLLFEWLRAVEGILSDGDQLQSGKEGKT